VISPKQGTIPDKTQHSQGTDIHAHGGIRTHNSSKQAAVQLCLKRSGPDANGANIEMQKDGNFKLLTKDFFLMNSHHKILGGS